MSTDCRRVGLWLLSFALLMMLQWPSLVASQEPSVENPVRIKAAFLRNFAHYVTWPAEVFPSNRTPWQIGILGPDPLGDVLETTLKGRVEQARPFEVYRADSLDRLPPCQIIYVAYSSAAARRAVLNELKSKPVLTVGDSPDFMREGGIIQFQVGERVTMNINLDQARSVSLAIQTRMLEVSNDILENGTIHKVK